MEHDGHPLLEGDDCVDVAQGETVEGRLGVNRVDDQFLGLGVNEDIVVFGGVVK